MKGRKISSKDVALRAGCSRTTVSFVLNNVPGKSISEDTRQRVLRAAQELDYIPNENARRLVMQKHKMVGLFVCHSHFVFSDMFITRLIEGISQVFNKNRIQLVLESFKLRDTNYLDMARHDDLDGVILANTHAKNEGIEPLYQSEFPLVILGNIMDSRIYQVDIDNRNAARGITEYMIQAGHRRIAIITHASLEFFSARERLNGYKIAMEENNLEIPDSYIRIGDFNEESGYKAMKELLKLKIPPQGVFCGNDIVAYGAMTAITDAGLSIPGDISIAGFDDDYISRYVNPPLTSVSLPAAGLGARAAQLIIEQMEGYSPSQQKLHILPTHIAMRESCKHT